jgi:glucokinase
MGRVAAVGVATPGTMDLRAGLILDPPNLKPWRDVPVRQYIADTFKRPTAFQNDANAAAYGEFWAGAGKEFNSMVLFTLGTGIGGGIILGDQVLEGEHSHGAELGHLKIELTNPRLCGCGKRGCLEAYASATAVVQRTQEALEAGRGKSSLRKRLREQGELTARDVFEAAEAGDALAAKVVDDTAFYLAVGAANLMHVVDPEGVCFAGGMTAAGEPFLAKIRRYVHDVAFPVPAAKCEIRYAVLGSDAGFIGAAGCARRLWLSRRGR